MENFPALAFDLAGLPLLIFWLLIVLLPKWSWTDRIYRTKLPMLYLAVLYGAVVVYGLIVDPAPFATLLDPDLPSVQALLGSEIGASAGWIHFLCFDLLVGTIIWRAALERGHSFLWVSPLLVLTLLLAPLGWLFFEGASRLRTSSPL
ncbi:MAG: ABA4-like family protein [Planctomycetota bacterium]